MMVVEPNHDGCSSLPQLTPQEASLQISPAVRPEYMIGSTPSKSTSFWTAAMAKSTAEIGGRFKQSNLPGVGSSLTLTAGTLRPFVQRWPAFRLFFFQPAIGVL